MARFNFDSTNVAPQQTLGVIPPGQYLAHITESDLVDLKSGNGQGLKLTFEIVDGPMKGRRVWDHLNVVHTNETAQAIAQAQLSAICRAVGVIKLDDTAVLHRKPLKITVAIKPAVGDFKEGNTIKGYDPVSGATPAPQLFQAGTPAANTPAPAPAKAAPAWAKRAA